jgi:hypothetical protein
MGPRRCLPLRWGGIVLLLAASVLVALNLHLLLRYSHSKARPLAVVPLPCVCETPAAAGGGACPPPHVANATLHASPHRRHLEPSCACNRHANSSLGQPNATAPAPHPLLSRPVHFAVFIMVSNKSLHYQVMAAPALPLPRARHAAAAALGLA